jgi:transcriptional regulator with PAS, ATPase and Fis domain
MRLGATKATKVDFRVLAASNQNLQECVETGQFRKTSCIGSIRSPSTSLPCVAEGKTIEPLVGYYLSHYGAKYGRAKWFSPKVMNILKEYPWPGNVRELKNFVERIMVMSASDVIEIKELPPNVLGETMECATAAKAEGRLPADAGARDEGYRYNGSLSLKENLSAFERSIIRQAVKQNGSLSKAAKVLKSSKATLSRKLNRQEDG